METQPTFFTREWADAARTAWNAGPDEAARAEKIEKFWDWIDKAKEGVDCTLGLAVRDLGDEQTAQKDCLLLELDKGVCQKATLVTRAEAEEKATYILAADLASWREILDGLDMRKAVMYRKLLLEKGSVLHFFRAAYYWTESLACIQRLPTAFA